MAGKKRGKGRGAGKAKTKKGNASGGAAAGSQLNPNSNDSEAPLSAPSPIVPSASLDFVGPGKPTAVSEGVVAPPLVAGAGSMASAVQHDAAGQPPCDEGTELSAPVQSQFHHFVPRLVLREFATAESRGLDHRNPFVNLYSMLDATITPTRVSRCYGYVDMYQDLSTSDVMHIEKALALLERRAGEVIARIRKAQEQNATAIIINRIEKNNIRKFMFVMRYRTPLFWAKYRCSMEDYKHFDRAEVLEFMRKKGFTKPIEVWLHNLKVILDTPIDPEDKWEKTIPETCFSHDGTWFVYDMNYSYMVLCQPKDLVDEFILSDSAFGIYEGPNRQSIVIDEQKPSTSKKTAGPDLHLENLALSGGPGSYAEYHRLAPFSPRLLVVLRSIFLRDGDSKMHMRKMAAAHPGYGLELLQEPSIFEHLPLDPAQPNYVKSGQHTDKDTFKFKLNKLCHDDVLLFNSIILANVRQNLTWHCNVATKRTLQEYLHDERFRLPMNPATAGFMFSDTEIQGILEVKRRQGLHKLLAKLNGYQGSATDIQLPPLKSHFRGAHTFEDKLLKNPLNQGYFKLGGTTQSYMQHTKQAFIVAEMRTMTANALPDGPRHLSYRQAVNRNKMAFFATLPPEVIYLHINTWRVIQMQRLAGPKITLKRMFNRTLDSASEELGAEQVVANLATKLPRQHLSRLMLQASVRRVSQLEDFRKGKGGIEYTIFAAFGSLTSSFLLESTPWYNPKVDKTLLDPYFDDQMVKNKLFMQEILVRQQVKKKGILTKKWGSEINGFVWQWLYDSLDDEMGGLMG